MKVKFFSTFREHAGVSTIDLNLNEQISIKQVIGILLDSYPSLQRIWLNESGELHGHVHITINQVDVMAKPDGLDTLVGQNDQLDFFPPITGG